MFKLVNAQPLPIDAHLTQLVQDLKETKQLILEAPPGTGKTTRFPLALLHYLELSAQQKIFVLVPRRPAAKLAAHEAARLLGEKVGQKVGYQFRFEKVGNDETKIWFLTEGTFLRKFLTQGNLGDAGAIVVDEFHERNLQGDVALGLVALARKNNPRLLLTVMSATMDSGPLKNYLSKFGPLTHRKIEQTSHPLKIEYLSPRNHEMLPDLAMRGLEKIWHEVQGDILLFLPGMSDIRKVEEKLRANALFQSALVTPLHGELSYEAQSLALYPSKEGKQKIILSTNIAESSVTIDGVRAVVDSGLHRLAIDSPMTGISSLHTKGIAKSSAIQRSGRAARQAPGLALRLYSENDFKSRSEFSLPEIRRNDLSEIILHIMLLGKKTGFALSEFPWFELPPKEGLEGAMLTLKNLKAVDQGLQITARGEELARERAHPRIATILVESRQRQMADLGAMAAAFIQEEQFENKNLAEVLEAFLTDRRPGQKNIKVMQTAKVLAGKNLSFDNGPADWREKLQEAIFMAFPDRVFKMQKKDMALLYQGDSATLESQEMAQNESGLGVALCVQERSNIQQNQFRKMEIFGFLPLSMEVLLLKEDWFKDEKRLNYNGERKRVEEKRELHFGKIILEENLSVPSDALAGTKMLLHALSRLPESEAWPVPSVLESLKMRLEYLRQQQLFVAGMNEKLAEGADLKSFALDCLAEAHAGIFSAQEVENLVPVAKNKTGHWARLALEEAQEEFIAASMSPQLAQLLKNETPLFLSLPRRQRVKINYENQKPPWIESFVQDFFGMTEVPKILGGKVDIVVHLLTPARRPMAVTTDLKSFFTNHYPKLRQEYQRRYPRHPWPLNPFEPLSE